MDGHTNTNLKQALNHRLVLKKVHRVINLNKEDCLKPYTDLKKKMILQFLEKPWKMQGNMEMTSL